MKLTKPEFLVQSYANEEPPDMLRPLVGRAALGTLSTVSLMKKPLAETELAVGLYTDYFGPVPYHRLAMAQQTACTFGQSWPQLVWLPICSFFDTTQRHQFGLDFRDRGYWKIVAPHEVAHQWWGHTVGFNSYRDQWMSEGFAELSASLYLQRDFTRFYCRNLTPLALTAAVCQRLRTVPLCSVSNETRTPLRIARFLLLYPSR